MESSADSGEDSLLEGDSEQRNFYLLFGHASKELGQKHSFCRQLVSKLAQRLRRIYTEERPWRNENFKGINFNEVKLCCAYLQRYAGCHAALARAVCVKLLEECSEFEEVCRRSQLHILSVGGGPGNDLLGFCSAMNSVIDGSTSLQLTVSDMYEGWASAFKQLVQAAKDGSFGDVNKLLDRSSANIRFVPCDLLSTSSSKIIEPADVIIMTKVLSVVPRQKRKAILERIFSSMKVGAIFVYIDINARFVVETALKFDVNVLFGLPQSQFVAYPRCMTAGIAKCTFEVCVLRKSLAGDDEGDVVDGPIRSLPVDEDDYDDDDDDDDDEGQGGLEVSEEIDLTTDEDVDHDVPECKCYTELENEDDIFEYY